MCSPEPGAGGRGHGGRGGGRNRAGHGGGGSKGGERYGSAGGGGLSEFWSCLDPKQRDSLLTINGRSVMATIDCELCRELLASATRLIDEGSKTDVPRNTPSKPAPNAPPGKSKPPKPKVKPKEKVVGLRLLEDGSYVPDFTPGDVKDHGQGFVRYSQGVFSIEQGEAVDFAVREMAATKDPWKEVEGSELCYCHGKFLLRVVDMLTYPRPVRKFEVLLDKHTKVSALRDVMVAEVKVESVAKLVLLTKGRPIGHDKNHLTLQELGFRSRQQLVVSQVLGGPSQDETGIEEKNRQFVGDLLFGGTAANNDSSAPKLNKASTTSPSGLDPPPPPPPPPLENPKASTSSSGRLNNADLSPSPKSDAAVDERDSKGTKGAVGAGALLEIVAETGARDGRGGGGGGGGGGGQAEVEGAAGNGGSGQSDPGRLSQNQQQRQQQQQDQPIIANHGYQVLGVTLERLTRAKVAAAWRAELEARENEIRLLEELEAEGGAGEDDGASKRRSKKAKRKERDKKRRDEEKRLQDEEEARRELLRQEKIKQAEERVEEERRARLLQEREEQERQEAQWKIAQERRMLAEKEQLEMQMSLLREQENAAAAANAGITIAAQKDDTASQNAGGGSSGGGTEKKAKGKKQSQQQPQQPRQSMPTQGSGAGTRQTRRTAAQQQQQKQQPQRSHPATQTSKPSRADRSIPSVMVTNTNRSSVRNVQGDPHRLSPSSSSSFQQHQHQQPAHPTPLLGTRPPLTAAGISQHAPAPVHPTATVPVQHQGPSLAGYQATAAAQHLPVGSMTTPPGLSNRVVGPPSSTVAGGVGAASMLTVDGVGIVSGGGGGFCAFCGVRLVAATANFCTYCGQPIIRSSPEVGNKSLASAPAVHPMQVPATAAQQGSMALAVGAAPPSSMPTQSSASTHSHAGHPGPVGGGRGGHHHHHHQHHSRQHQPPPPSIPPPSITSSSTATSSPTSLADDLASMTICSSNSAAAAGGGMVVGGNVNSDLNGVASAGGAPSSTLPFFAQFRGGAVGLGGGEGIAASTAVSRSVSDGAAPGPSSSFDNGSHSVQGVPGAGGAVGMASGPSNMGGILEAGLGTLDGSSAASERVMGDDRANDVGDARRTW